MLVLLWAFSGFHLVAGAASLGLAVRLLTEEERAHWRSRRLLWIAEATAWVYPATAVACSLFAWQGFQQGRPEITPIILLPLCWLLALGLVFAIVDYLEDGVLGNARSPDPANEP